MKLPQSPRTRILIAFVAVVFAIAVLVLWLSTKTRDGRKHILTWARFSDATPAQTATPVINSPSPAATQSAAPSVAASPINTPSPQPLAPSQANLIIPVMGVTPEQLRDTFADARSEGRVHDAIDIAAPHGTPVIAAADGPIVKLFPSERGGTTIYQLSTDGRYVYYYAHLDRYAEGLAVGHFAKQGETLAYVGDTGNAGAGNYHLHFSIALIADPKRYWEGTNINPYPLLRH
jgi:murein DD-endopeptidase MepM/ murein hydrolase activator NlpD